MLRPETKSRARALQLLYAWELQGGPGIPVIASGLSRLTGPEPRILDRAEELATDVVAEVGALDAEAARASENWRLSRIAVVERNILRLGIHELRRGDRAAQGRDRRGGPSRSLVWRRACARIRERRARRNRPRDRTPVSPPALDEHPARQLAGPTESAGGRSGGSSLRDLRATRRCGPSSAAGLFRLGGSAELARRWMAYRSSAAVGGAASRSWAAGPCGARFERNDRMCWSRTSTSCRSISAGRGVPFCAIVPHLFGETVFREAAWPVAAAVWLAERPLPYGYRDAPFHVISESTRDDLVARGVPSGHVRVIHPGVDSAHADSRSGRRAARPLQPSCTLDG